MAIKQWNSKFNALLIFTCHVTFHQNLKLHYFKKLHILKTCTCIYIIIHCDYSKTVLRLVAGRGSDATAATTKHEPVISMGILGWAFMNNPNNTMPSIAPTLATLSNIPLAVDLQ